MVWFERSLTLLFRQFRLECLKVGSTGTRQNNEKKKKTVLIVTGNETKFNVAKP